jgi:hypothetical protein
VEFQHVEVGRFGDAVFLNRQGRQGSPRFAKEMRRELNHDGTTARRHDEHDEHDVITEENREPPIDADERQ